MEAIHLLIVLVAGLLRFVAVLAWQYAKPILKFLGFGTCIFLGGFLLWLLAFLCLGGYAWAALLDWRDGMKADRDFWRNAPKLVEEYERRNHL